MFGYTTTKKLWAPKMGGVIVWKNLDITHDIPNTMHFIPYEQTLKILFNNTIHVIDNIIIS
jgi:hypothetical protein